MKKLWVMNIKDNREINEKFTDITKFQFCLQNGIVGIGWGNELDLPDEEKSENHLKALDALENIEIDDYIWIAEDSKYYIAIAKSTVINAPKEYHDYDIAYYIVCDFYEVGEEFPKELNDFKNRLIAHSTIQEKRYDELLYNKIDQVLNNIKSQASISDSKKVSFFKKKQNIIILGLVGLLLFVLIITFSTVQNNKQEVQKQKIKKALSGMVFSSVDNTKLSIITVNDKNEYLEETFRLSSDEKTITERISSYEAWSTIDISFLDNQYHTSIGIPIYEGDKIIGLDDAIDYSIITDEHKIAKETFLEREKTKITLSELSPKCSDFLQKSISLGNLADNLKTEYAKDYLDITVKNDSVGVLSMRVYITYPTMQTPYSDAKITGLRVSAVYRNRTNKHILQKYIIPFLEYFPNSLSSEENLVNTIKQNGKRTYEEMIKYYEITNIYKDKGITYSYSENIAFDSSNVSFNDYLGTDVSFHDVLEITINEDYNIYLADYPEYSK